MLLTWSLENPKFLKTSLFKKHYITLPKQCKKSLQNCITINKMTIKIEMILSQCELIVRFIAHRLHFSSSFSTTFYLLHWAQCIWPPFSHASEGSVSHPCMFKVMYHFSSSFSVAWLITYSFDIRYPQRKYLGW